MKNKSHLKIFVFSVQALSLFQELTFFNVLRKEKGSCLPCFSNHKLFPMTLTNPRGICHLFDKYVMNPYYVPGIVLSAGEPRVSTLCFWVTSTITSSYYKLWQML